MANPITILKEDHRKVQALFREYEDLGDGATKTKNRIAMEIINELTIHAEMEEAILYPFLKQEFGIEGGRMVEEAIAEHAVAKNLMSEIDALEPEDPQFEAKMKVLDENINHHIKEEEVELLPLAKKELSDESLDTLGEEMLVYKGE